MKKKRLETKITQIKKREKNHEVQFSTNQILNDKIKKKHFKKRPKKPNSTWTNLSNS
jgi:hypothetical protein